MQDGRLSDVIKASLEGIKGFADINTVIGKEIVSPNGVTVIPVSKISVAFANGGVDFAPKKSQPNQNYGCGGGTGVSITPLGFLVIDPKTGVDLIPISKNESTADRILSLIDRAPDILSGIVGKSIK